MDNELFKLYVLAELSYKKHFSNLNDDELFPSGWYGNKNYQKKIEIICEAIETNTLIVNTKSYLDIIEKKYVVGGIFLLLLCKLTCKNIY